MNVYQWVLRTLTEKKLIENLLLNLTNHDLNNLLTYLDYENAETQKRWLKIHTKLFSYCTREDNNENTN